MAFSDFFLFLAIGTNFGGFAPNSPIKLVRRTCHKEPADGKFEDVTKEILDGLESDTDE